MTQYITVAPALPDKFEPVFFNKLYGLILSIYISTVVKDIDSGAGISSAFSSISSMWSLIASLIFSRASS